MKKKGGRPRNNIPYRRSDGTWVVREKGQIVATGQSKEEVLAAMARRGDGFVVDLDEPLKLPFVPDSSTPPSDPTPVPPGPTSNPLMGFLGLGSSPTPAEKPSTTTEVVKDDKPQNAMQLSSAERDQMHGMLSQIVGQLNVAVIGFTVKVFGRQPEPPTPADLELLNKAWQMQLNIWFADTTISPWVCILGASLGLGFAMWAGGEPIPPKPKKRNGTSLGIIPGGLPENSSPVT